MIGYQYEPIPDDVNTNYLNKIESIERLKEKLHITENDLQPILIGDVHETTSLEGNQLTAKEVTFYLENDVTIRGESFRDYVQIRNCKDTFEIVKTLLREQKVELSEDFICEIHKLLTQGELPYTESGFYRTDSVHIRYTNYIPPTEDEVPEDMQELIAMYHRPMEYGITMFEHICEFKRNFERIHPFFDGNGRTGRVIMNILFLQNGYGYISIPAEERDLYFNALENNTLHEYLVDKMLNVMQDIWMRHESAREEEVDQYDMGR